MTTAKPFVIFFVRLKKGPQKYEFKLYACECLSSFIPFLNRLATEPKIIITIFDPELFTEKTALLK